MEEYKSTVFYLEKPLLETEKQKIKVLIEKTEGIQSFNITNELISLNYNSFILSKNFLQQLFSKSGILFKTENEKPGFFTRIIQNMINENKQAYGNKKLDCCDLNH
ncbi:MAG: hypothetical protein GXO79_15220 [Chlorobi bacterium]|nr:hypothetical protein [Chlorobiota bacterium]